MDMRWPYSKRAPDNTQIGTLARNWKNIAYMKFESNQVSNDF